MSATPRTTNSPRSRTAPRMPQKRTRWRYSGGVPKYLKMMMKTKMLSTESACSIRYPAKNSSPRSAPASYQVQNPKAQASDIQIATQTAASRKRTSCASRWKTNRSRASAVTTTTPKTPHIRGVPTLSFNGPPPLPVLSAARSYLRDQAGALPPGGGKLPPRVIARAAGRRALPARRDDEAEHAALLGPLEGLGVVELERQRAQ